MKLVTVNIKPFKFDEVREALAVVVRLGTAKQIEKTSTAVTARPGECKWQGTNPLAGYKGKRLLFCEADRFPDGAGRSLSGE